MEKHTEKLANQIEQIELVMDGMLDRLGRMETLCEEFKISRPRPRVYIDDQTALISSHEADIIWMDEETERKKQDELSNLRNKQLLQGD